MSPTTSADQMFWDRQADRYAAKPIRNVPAYETSLARVRAHLAPHIHALELGCGTGSTAVRLAPHVDHLTATDVSGRMIEIAERRRVAAGLGNLRFARATLEDMPASSGSVHVVLGFNYLHLLPNLQDALARCRDLLGVDGLLITKTPCTRAVSPLLRLAIPLLQLVGMCPSSVNLRHGDELEAEIMRAGFDILETGEYPKHSRFIVARKAGA